MTEVTEHFTQDGYDWPAGCTDERWPVDKHQPMAPHFNPLFEGWVPDFWGELRRANLVK